MSWVAGEVMMYLQGVVVVGVGQGRGNKGEGLDRVR